MKLTKAILQEYVDACELIRETEQDIAKLQKKKKTIVQDSVKGSMQDFPYAAQSYHLEGIQYGIRDEMRIKREENLLQERKANAERIRSEVEMWMNTIPVRMQRIIKYRFFEGLSWEQAAGKMGRRSTGESIKKEFQRFIKEN